MAIVEGPPWPLLALGLPGALAFAIGWRDRALTLVLIALVGGLAALVDGAPLMLPQTDVLITAGLLVLHLCTPITPFGSLDARGRIDPRGDWERPVWLGHLAWVWLAAIHLARGLVHWTSAARTTAELDFAIVAGLFALLELAFLLATFRIRWRPAAWTALTLWQIGWLAAFGFETGDGALLLLHFFAADPSWWPGRSLHPVQRASHDSAGPQATLFYDGSCGFCHRSVRIILSEELNTPPSLRLRFAPLEGEVFARTVAGRDDLDPSTLPDSIVLLTEDGAVLTQSTAALEIASRLGGVWRGIALVFGVLPRGLLDRAYDSIARVRKRLFAEPKDACPILPPDLRARFDL